MVPGHRPNNDAGDEGDAETGLGAVLGRRALGGELLAMPAAFELKGRACDFRRLWRCHSMELARAFS